MKLVDLSHPLIDDQPAYPGDPTPRIKTFHSHAESGFATTRFAMGTHHGTHLDAPFHFVRDGVTVDRIPLETLYGPAALIDLAPQGVLGKSTVITVEMLARHAEALDLGERLIYRTGWDSRFGRPEFYKGHPSLTVEAARWIVDRGVRLLGMDTPSPAEDFEEVHKILLGAGVIIAESLANLTGLPGSFLFVGFPIKLKGRDGAPIRAVAILE